MKSKNTLSTFLLAVTVLLLISGATPFPAIALGETALEQGPYLDRIRYDIIPNTANLVQAIHDDDIDILQARLDDSIQFLALDAATNIEIAKYDRNGYGYAVLNTAKYPLSITALRRAIAFACDKQAICTDLFEGMATPQDSPIPLANPYCIDGDLSYDYYASDIDHANQLLDDAGFLIPEGETYRHAPNGTPFNITIEVSDSWGISIELGAAFESAMQALHVDAVSQPTGFYEILTKLNNHLDYDMTFLGRSIGDFDVTWMAYEFWSDYADTPFINFANFANTTFDAYRDDLLNSPYHDEVMYALDQMQEILVYECPIIICYNNFEFGLYRTDKFEGFVDDIVDSVPCWWTNYQTHLMSSQGGPFGGTFRIGIPESIDTFNFMATSSEHTALALSNMYDSLMRRSPTGELIPWLAESFTTETNDDNPDVPVGRTRFTFELVDNAKWTDNASITAEDVAFTFNFYKDGSGNPYGEGLESLLTAYSTTSTTVVIEFGALSYWEMNSIFLKPILPEHVFSEIGASGWNSWDPDPMAEPMVTSGLFVITEYVSDGFLELSPNPSYFNMAAVLLSSPADITFTQGGGSRSISWQANSSSPDRYELYRNSTLIFSGDWDGSDLTFYLHSLEIGVYNFTLVVYDRAGNSASDTVWVKLESYGGLDITAFILQNLVVIVITGTAAVILVVSVLYPKFRR
jgi:ABC-type transport system substrate-binding protein